MKLPTYREAKKGTDPVSQFVTQYEPGLFVDRAPFREDLQKVIDHIEKTTWEKATATIIAGVTK